MEKTGDTDGRMLLQVLSDTGPRSLNTDTMLSEVCTRPDAAVHQHDRGLECASRQDHLPCGNGDGLAISRKPTRLDPPTYDHQVIERRLGKNGKVRAPTHFGRQIYQCAGAATLLINVYGSRINAI